MSDVGTDYRIGCTGSDRDPIVLIIQENRMLLQLDNSHVHGDGWFIALFIIRQHHSSKIAVDDSSGITVNFTEPRARMGNDELGQLPPAQVVQFAVIPEEGG